MDKRALHRLYVRAYGLFLGGTPESIVELYESVAYTDGAQGDALTAAITLGIFAASAEQEMEDVDGFFGELTDLIPSEAS